MFCYPEYSSFVFGNFLITPDFYFQFPFFDGQFLKMGKSKPRYFHKLIG